MLFFQKRGSVVVKKKKINKNIAAYYIFEPLNTTQENFSHKMIRWSCTLKTMAFTLAWQFLLMKISLLHYCQKKEYYVLHTCLLARDLEFICSVTEKNAVVFFPLLCTANDSAVSDIQSRPQEVDTEIVLQWIFVFFLIFDKFFLPLLLVAQKISHLANREIQIHHQSLFLMF